MIRNYLKSTIRNIQKNKIFSAINIVGFAIGLSGCLLILQYVAFETSYNKFHQKSKDIYRVSYSKEKGGVTSFNTTLAYSGVGPLLKENFDEITDFARLRPASVITATSVMTYGDNAFEENRVYFTDASFLKIFSFELISGDRESALDEQFSMLISESTAKKYFGSEDPLGKIIRQGLDRNYRVTGVFKDVPANSHIKFDFLLSHATLSAVLGPNWSEDNITTFHGHLYILTKPGTDPKQIETRLPQFVDDHVGGLTLKENGVTLKLAMMPLEDIHLHSNIEHEAEVNGDANSITYLSVIAVLILVIAWVNYINLSTARSMERATEVGVRKVMGAQKTQLIKQFLFESSLVNLLALGLAVVMVWLSQPLFERLDAGQVLSQNIWSNPYFWLAVGLLLLAGILFSGIYPAFALSAFKPVAVLKSGRSGKKQNFGLRKVLVVFQFTASVALIIGTIIVYQQIQFMRNVNLGVNIDHAIAVRAPLLADSTYGGGLQSFKTEMLRDSRIQSIAATLDVPGSEYNSATWFRRINQTREDASFVYRSYADEDYFPAMEINLLAGRNFTAEDNNRSSILNLTAAKQFGFDSAEDAIGEELTFSTSDNTQRWRVVGVIDDYHHLSPKQEHLPLMVSYFPQVRNYYLVKFNAGDNPSSNVQEVIELAETTYQRIFHGNPFNYFFVQSQFENQFKADKRFGSLIGIFSVLALLVGCLGLFGLSSYLALQRTKEIGIRKVLGSSVSGIMTLLSRDFIKLVIIANIIAWPLAYYVMTQWLDTFANHISIALWVFPLACAAVAVIALATVSFHTLRSARANPAKSLKHE